MPDFATFEIIAERETSNDRVRRIDLRCIAEIDGVGYLQDDIALVYPADIDTPDKMAVHINQYVVAPWFAELTKPPEPAPIECPVDGTPLQKGECMVCGFKVI
jgi:hypothetical protein